MARKPTGNPPGPVPKPFDAKMFEQCCNIQCTLSEICSFLKMDDETLRKKVLEHFGEEYSIVYKRFSESGLCSLRRKQFVMASKNASMGIWLGKIWLGQRDPQASNAEKMMGALANLLNQVTNNSKDLIDVTGEDPILGLKGEQKLIDKQKEQMQDADDEQDTPKYGVLPE